MQHGQLPEQSLRDAEHPVSHTTTTTYRSTYPFSYIKDEKKTTLDIILKKDTDICERKVSYFGEILMVKRKKSFLF